MNAKPIELTNAEPGIEWSPCPEIPAERWRARWVIAKAADGTEFESHWACDLSGEEQPPFLGWFDRSYRQVSNPKEWRRIIPCGKCRGAKKDAHGFECMECRGEG